MHPNPNTLIAAALACGLFNATAFAADTSLVKRGAQLVAYGGCVDCHTPFKMNSNGPEKDIARGLSGHPEEIHLPPSPKLDNTWNWAGSATMTAFVGPWGTTYASNLTPDRETGIGTWREKDFIQAMRSGKHVGVARPIMPPMPWQAVSSLPEKDLRAIFAYLTAQPAVKNRVPDYVPPASSTSKAAGSKTSG